MSRINLLLAGLLLVAALPATLDAQDDSPDAEAMIKDALSATTAEMAKGATVVDWESNVLKEGDNGWTCFPTTPQGSGPMCVDEPWLAWADGWMNKKEVNITRVGLAYMLAGSPDSPGGSNTDPYATEAAPDNEWLPPGGPHLMLVVPDPSMLEGIPTYPVDGGPWVMWKDTPYVHVMVPVED